MPVLFLNLVGDEVVFIGKNIAFTARRYYFYLCPVRFSLNQDAGKQSKE